MSYNHEEKERSHGSKYVCKDYKGCKDSEGCHSKEGCQHHEVRDEDVDLTRRTTYTIRRPEAGAHYSSSSEHPTYVGDHCGSDSCSRVVQGCPGQNGRDGKDAGGSMMAFTSGPAITFAPLTPGATVATDPNAVAGTVYALAFTGAGAAPFVLAASPTPMIEPASGSCLTAGQIDISGGPVYAFPLSRPATLTSIAADLSLSVPFTPGTGTSASVVVQVFTAPAGSNIFTPLPMACVTLGPLTATALTGTVISRASPTLNITLAKQTRILVVSYQVTRNASGTVTTAAPLSGFVDASLNFL